MNDPILHFASAVLRVFLPAASREETSLASDKLWSKSHKEKDE